MDATDLTLYPANSALSNRNKFAITHLEWIMGVRKEYAGALFPIPDIGTIGVYSQIFTPGEFTQARDIDENVSHPQMLEFTGGFSLAKSFLNKKVHLGLGISYIESRIDDAAGRAVSFSSNLLLTPLPRFSLQLNCAHLGTPVHYTNISEQLPAQAGLSCKVTPLPDYLPVTSYMDFEIGAGVKKIADEPLIAGVNTDVLLFNTIHLLTGYDYAFGRKISAEGLGIGAGMQLGMYGFDCAWKNQSSELGSVWAVTLKLQLSEKQPLTAEDYYLAAVKFFNRKNLTLATFYAKKALQLDPSMWKAHSLLLKIKSQYLRNRNLEIGLFYTGNIRGSFTIPFDPQNTGGVARITTLLKTLRKEYPVLLSIESGNFIPKSSHPFRIKCASQILKYANYDALCCGSEELSLGMNAIQKASGDKTIKRILSNISDDHNMLTKKVIESNGYRLFIATYIGNQTADKNNNTLQPFTDGNKLLDAESFKCDLRVLVIDDTWNNVRQIASKLKAFDIIICNDNNQQFSSPIKIGNATILSPGKNGEYAGYCSIRFNESKKLVSLENHIVPINSEITPDPVVDSLVKGLSAQIEFADQGIDSVNLVRSTGDGSFIFLSDRDSTSGIYFKNVKLHAEFPLTRGSGNCDLPAHAFKKELIACQCKVDDNPCGALIIMSVSGASKHIVQDSISVKDMIFSPDGNWLYYSSSVCNSNSYDISRVRYDGGKPVPVIDWKGSSEQSISASPDNSTIAFCSDRDGSSQVYVCGFDGTRPVRITDSASDYTTPLYSPTGHYLAYLSNLGNYHESLDLWVYDMIKGVHRQITSHANVQSYCWLGDGETVVYSSGINIYDLNKVNVEQLRYSRLIIIDTLKTWSDITPHAIQLEGNEKILFVREFADGIKNVMIVNTDGKQVMKVIDSNGNDWLP
jgi:Tol biopolymer transport system component